jgi:NTP pyrophosphatase (non-canonical NTP hydrolase)
MKEQINTWAQEITYANAQQGFWEEHYDLIDAAASVNVDGLTVFAQKALVAMKLALIHSEVSEALEAERKDLMDTHLPHRSGLEVELADAMIRILDLAGGLNLDLGGAVEEKLEYNKSRPYRHGKKF